MVSAGMEWKWCFVAWNSWIDWSVGSFIDLVAKEQVGSWLKELGDVVQASGQRVDQHGAQAGQHVDRFSSYLHRFAGANAFLAGLAEDLWPIWMPVI
ncbi:hypothetical protein Nepgr_006453 [Nepenthes gracilis]|uniref:Uncharacterized protein n=1 Tax=Nepenthes gracilis TaxID=150966 RepID=A0AAD3S557_NEPGR|nr:hypothetical protein Nepgr_006453 [Nepenthes gracilis]